MGNRGCWPWTLVLLLAQPALAPAQCPGPTGLPPGVKCLQDLEYVRRGHERNKLDLYLPQKRSRPLPVIVWIHGGAWEGGSKSERPPALFLVPKGYAVASIGYRLSKDAIFPAQIQDCKAAIRWLRANAAKYRLDGDHIGAGAARQAATSRPCWARRTGWSSSRGRAGTSIAPAACRPWWIGSARPT